MTKGGSPRDEGPRRVGESLDRLLGTMEAPPADVLTTVFGEWAEIVGEDLAAHSRPTALDRGRLVVTCDSAAWAGEFRWLESQVLEKISRTTGSERISALTVRVDSRL